MTSVATTIDEVLLYTAQSFHRSGKFRMFPGSLLIPICEYTVIFTYLSVLWMNNANDRMWTAVDPAHIVITLNGTLCMLTS